MCENPLLSWVFFLRLASISPPVYCSSSHPSSHKWPQRQTHATLTTSSLHRPLLSRHLTNVSTSVLPHCLSAWEAQLFCLFEKRSNIRGATLWKITPNSDGDQFLIFVLFILHMYSGLSKKKKCGMVIYWFLRGGHCTQKWRGKGAGFIWLEKSQHTSTESVVLTGRSSYDNLINPDIWIRSEMFLFFFLIEWFIKPLTPPRPQNYIFLV